LLVNYVKQSQKNARTFCFYGKYYTFVIHKKIKNMTEFVLKNNIGDKKLNSIVSFLRLWGIDVEYHTPRTTHSSFADKWAGKFSLVTDTEDERYNMLLNKYDLQ
jgi:hypothetical protein